MKRFDLSLISQQHIKTIKSIFFCIIIGIASGFLLISCVYAIPTDRIFQNVKESADTFEEEGRKPFLFGVVTMRDNVSDIVMLETAAYDDGENVLYSAMNNARPKSSKGDIETLRQFVSGNDELAETSYARYWHGYLVFLKPLLYIMSYDAIRLLNFLLQSFLLLLIINELVKCEKNQYIIPVGTTFIFMFPFTIGLNLHSSSVYYISLLTILFIMKYNEWLMKKNFIFCCF